MGAGSGRVWAGRALQVLGLTGLAVLQPYLDVTARNPEVFVAYEVGWVGAVLLALGVVAVPTAVVLGMVGLAERRSARAGALTLAVASGVLVGLFAVQLADHALGLPPVAALLAGVLATLLAARAFDGSDAARTAARVAAAAVPVFVAGFVLASPATAVLVGRTDGVAGPARAAHPSRVVLVVLDELPTVSLGDGRGGIDAELFPSLAALAADGTWYRNHTTVAAFTDAAVPAILTGRFPRAADDQPVLADHPRNLFTLFERVGPVHGHESVTRLCPARTCARRAHDLAGLAGVSTRLWLDFARPGADADVAPDVVDRTGRALDLAEEFVASLGPGERGLDVVHLELPHSPWERLPDGRRYDKPLTPRDESHAVHPAGPGPEVARTRHLLQAQAADRVVGRVVDRLRRLGVYDDAMVVVTADHGVSFTPGQPLRNPTRANLAEVMWSPLVVKYPHGEGAGVVDDRPAESVDVLPTIADVAGLRIPWSVDGVSLRGDLPARRRRRIYPLVPEPLPGDLRLVPGEDDARVPRDLGLEAVRTAAPVPAGPDPALRIYRRGRDGDLVGRRVGAVGRADPAGATMQLDGLDALRDVRTGDGDLDWVFHEGRLPGAGGGVTVAIALDGTIVGVAETAENDSASFAVVVAAPLVRPGPHRVTAYRVRGTGADRRLVPVPVQG